MKSILPSIKRAALAFLFIAGMVPIAGAQSLKSVFSDSETPLVYLGIDFSKARLLDNGNPNDIRDRLYTSINQLIVNEPKKYDLKSAFRKSNINYDMGAVMKNYANVNLNDIISTNSADYNRLKEADISAIVKSLDLSGKEGVGLLFVMEAMKKIDKKGEAAIWVTFVDMKTKKVLKMKQNERTNSMAIGLLNNWESVVKRMIDFIE